MGPLAGVKVLEIAGIGPGPFCGMLLADMGAEVLRVDRASAVPAEAPGEPPLDFMARGKRSIAVDLKHPDGVETVLRLAEGADVIFEGFRPGVMERLGLGPDAVLARNPGIVYGRMTGWGQEGPMAQAAGHDINYIALSGVLDSIGRPGQPPTPPLNLVGDLGGGGMVLAFGIACALVERARSGLGQVIDCAMVDGSAVLMTMIYASLDMGMHSLERGTGLLSGAAHFYDAYETADGKYVAVGSIEPQFYALFLDKLGLAGEALPAQMDPAGWPGMKEKVAAAFKTKTRDEWRGIMEGTDVCFAPVLSMLEAPDHPHNKERGTFLEVAGKLQPAPAPRFSRTAPEIASPPPYAGQHTESALGDWGIAPGEVEKLRRAGAVR